MEIHPDQKDYYEILKHTMLFACIWTERPEGGYNSTDCRPFVAIDKGINKGVKFYEGHYIDARKKFDEGGKALKDPEDNFQRQITIDSGLTYKPVTSFEASGHDRIYVTNDLDEICRLYLARFNKPAHE